MKNKRIIARLDIKNNSVVKGVNMEGLRVIGHPQSLANSYYKNGIAELLYMDVVASLYDRNGLTDIVRETAKEVFVPISVGGGIRTVCDVSDLLAVGADKITVNTAAVRNLKFINEIAMKYGSSTIVSSIETLKIDGDYFVFTDCGREFSNIKVCDWIKQVQDEGAGEIVISSISKDGTGEGFDFELIDKIGHLVGVPLVVHGGAGSVQHVKEVLSHDAVDGVCISSILHYAPQILGMAKETQLEGNTSFAQSRAVSKLIKPSTVNELKQSIRAPEHSLK